MSTTDNLFEVKILKTDEIRSLFDEHSTRKISWLCDDILFQISDELYLGWDDSAAGQSPELLALCNINTNQLVSFPPFEAGAVMAQLLTVERWVYEHNKNGDSGNCDFSEMFKGMSIEVAIDLDDELVSLTDLNCEDEFGTVLSFDCALSKSISHSIISCVQHIDQTVSQGRGR